MPLSEHGVSPVEPARAISADGQHKKAFPPMVDGKFLPNRWKVIILIATQPLVALTVRKEILVHSGSAAVRDLSIRSTRYLTDM